MNTEIKTNFYTIFSQRLAGYLMMNGLPLVKLVPDNSGGSKNSFLFVNSAKLHELMDKWTAEKNKNSQWQGIAKEQKYYAKIFQKSKDLWIIRCI